MLKSALAASAIVAVGATTYLVHAHRAAPTSSGTPPALHYGGGHLGLAHPPSLGPTAAPRAIHSRSVAEADLALLPADSDAVIGVNFAQVRQSVLWQRFIVPKLDEVDAIREFEALCGFDPLTSLSSISLGLKGLGNEDKVSGTIVIHGFDKAKALSCFDKHGVEDAEKDGSQVTTDGEVVLMTDASGEHVGFTFVDDTTAVVVLGADAATKQGVERVAAGNGGLVSSSAFVDTLQNINTDDSLWLMLSSSSPLVDIVNTAIAQYTSIKLGTVYASLNVTDTLALDAGLHLGSPSTVARLVSAIQTQMNDPGARAKVSRHFDQLDVMTDGADMIISLAMSGDQLFQLFSSLAADGDAATM